MNKKVRIISLAVVAAAAALTAIVASSQAEEKIYFQAQYTVEEDEEHIETVDELGIFEAEGGDDNFQAFGASIGCEHSQFTGEIARFGSPTMSLSPHYSGCTGLEGNLPVTITTNTCVYSFTLGEKIAADTYELSTDVNCTGGSQIEIHAYLNATKHGEKKSMCTVTVGAQKGLKGLQAKVNTLPDPTDVTISGVLKEIAVTQDRNSFLCPAGVVGKAEYEISGEKGLTVQVRNETNETIDYTINPIGP
jgi:hypothetical protein